MFRLAHLSDPHLAPLPPVRPRELLGKRLLGYLSWRLKRHRRHRRAVLDALVRDLHGQRPDHVALTGDLVNISLPAEFEQVATWLPEVGPPEQVSVIPGNHDAYVAMRPADSWDHFARYMAADEPRPPDRAFPYLRRRGPLAVVGLSTAIASPPGFATGRLGRDQLAALDGLLEQLAGAGLCRVVLLHHPPLEGVSKWRKRLIDATAFGRVIARRGAELILHGHEHVVIRGRLQGPRGPVPVFGAASASRPDERPDHCAQYQIFAIAARDEGWQIDVESRRFDPATGRLGAA